GETSSGSGWAICGPPPARLCAGQHSPPRHACGPPRGPVLEGGPGMYQDKPCTLCPLRPGGPAGGGGTTRFGWQGEVTGRLKVAAAVPAGALAGGLAAPSAASADTTQVVYAWGYNSWGQAGADPNITGLNVLSPVPVHGGAANVTQLSGPI